MAIMITVLIALTPLLLVYKQWITKFIDTKLYKTPLLPNNAVISDGQNFNLSFSELCFSVQYANMLNKEANVFAVPYVHSFSKDQFKIAGYAVNPTGMVYPTGLVTLIAIGS